jgi:predicted O-methyltransferase YrrM
VKIIEGAVPETLAQVNARRIAYLHLDMNNPKPETAALRYFWDKLTPGAVILLDDYAFAGYEAQKTALDAVARELGRPIASLPTGQGLLLR